MIKLIISDMDGTLLKNDLSVSNNNLEAIKKIREKGIKFLVATGRPDQLMKEYVDLLGLNEPFIMYNGTVIGHPFMETRVYEKHLSTTDAYEIINYMESNDILYMVYTKDAIISKPHYRSDFFKKRNDKLDVTHQSNIVDIDNFKEKISDYKIIKVLAIEKNETKYNQMKRDLEKNKNLSVVKSQNSFLDINPAGTSKGIALSHLADYYQISKDEIIVFGDQDNDVPMFEFVTTSVAMNNANDNVKKHASKVTLSNEEDGFAVWINENIENM